MTDKSDLHVTVCLPGVDPVRIDVDGLPTLSFSKDKTEDLILHLVGALVLSGEHNQDIEFAVGDRLATILKNYILEMSSDRSKYEILRTFYDIEIDGYANVLWRAPNEEDA